MSPGSQVHLNVHDFSTTSAAPIPPTPPHSQVRSVTGSPAASSSPAVTVALPDLFHPFSSSSPSTSPSTWTSFGASAEASSFPPPHTSNLHSFSLSPSQGRHPLRQLRQQGRGRIRRRRRPPVARRRRRRYRPRHPPWCAPARRRDRRQDRPPSPPGRRRPCHRRPGLPRRPWRRCRCRQPPSPPPTPPMDRSHARTGARTGGCVIILLCMVGLVHVHAKA